MCDILAELEIDVVPIVLQLAKSEMSDDFRSEAAGVSTDPCLFSRLFNFSFVLV